MQERREEAEERLKLDSFQKTIKLRHRKVHNLYLGLATAGLCHECACCFGIVADFFNKNVQN